MQRGEILRSLLGLGRLGPQMSVGFLAEPSADQSIRLLKLRVSLDLLRHWRAVEAEFRARAGPRASFVSFVSFACACLWLTWRPFLQAWDDKWKEILERDRHQCTSPVCERHDVTLHHLEFRAHGGTDAPENLTSGCSWCHIEGIHRGRLKAEPPASRVRWTIGREPIMVVEGREKKIVG
ncbi:MAG: HNH endonuclease [Deltaproteobacteria bacterium]|nr:HNH endonuclease [Deltaproteobacteria bacterium]